MKKRASAVVALLLLAIALDLRRPPSEQWTTAAAVGGIHLYQATLSPFYEKVGVRCRFTLTCSHYGEEVVKRFGVCAADDGCEKNPAMRSVDAGGYGGFAAGGVSRDERNPGRANRRTGSIQV